MDRRDIKNLVHNYKNEIIRFIQDLVKIPSENDPPGGNELKAQMFLAEWLKKNDIEYDVFTPFDIKGILKHEAYWPGRNYKNRPNIVARLKGIGNGRSIMLSGHIDTVSGKLGRWKVSTPFSGKVIGERLYGRGSMDMKGGLGASAFLLKILKENNIKINGDVLFESVVDEEYCGSNGSLAGRLRGYNPDVVIIPETTNLSICPACKGCKIYEIKIEGTPGHSSDTKKLNPIFAIARIIDALNVFETIINYKKNKSGFFQMENNPRKIAIGKLCTTPELSDSEFGMPNEAKVSVVVLTLPGFDEKDLDSELIGFIKNYCSIDPILNRFVLSKCEPVIKGKTRYVSPVENDVDHPIFKVILDNYELLLNRKPTFEGAKFACDAFIFTNYFSIPTVIFGPKGGNAHGPDEWVDINSIFDFMTVMLATILKWCN